MTRSASIQTGRTGPTLRLYMVVLRLVHQHVVLLLRLYDPRQRLRLPQ